MDMNETIDAMQARRDALDAQIKTAKEAAKREKIELERAARQAAAEAHYAKMLDEIGRPLAGLNEAQHGIVYAAAYDQGHSSGYDEVEMYYGEFAEMARKLLAAN
jgi:multidrug resistance efflux pump